MSTPRIAIATNNGDIGGGEVMLLNIALSLQRLGIEPVVLAPTGPGDILGEARDRGIETIALNATGRREYMVALAIWRMRHRDIPLWCNGLVPSMATAGMGPRLVHLHIVPTGSHRLASRIAKFRAVEVLVPSAFMAREIEGSRVLPNWTEDITFAPPTHRAGEPMRVGFMGRFTRDKGLDVLADAVETLTRRDDLDVRLVLAGENRFGTADDDSAIARALAPIEDRVERLGWVERRDFFQAVDLAVFPSTLPEPFGLVAAEAMAAGVPFVISDAGALPEVAGPAHPWIARGGDARDLAEVIGAALTAPQHHRSDALLRSRQRWEELFSPLAGTRAVAKMLQDISRMTERPDHAPAIAEGRESS